MTRHLHQETKPDWSLVRKVLVIRLRSIGDTVLLTPSLARLKAWRPDIEVSVLMERLAAPLLEDHPLVDRLLIADRSVSSRLRLISQLRRERFDIALNMHGGTTATILAALSGARWSVGFRGHRKSWMLTARAPAPDVILHRASIHSVEQQLSLLHWSGVPWPAERPRLQLAISGEASDRMREKLKAAGVDKSSFAALAPAAAFESKQWPATGFAAIADHLSARWNLPGVVIAGPGQEHIAHEVARAALSKPIAITGLSLKELSVLLSLARVFVGNDSGPAHIAAAFGRPMVVLFGSSNPTVWHPWTDSPYRVVEGCGRDEAKSRAIDLENIIKQIPVSDVIEAVEDVLKPALEANYVADASTRPKRTK